MPQRAQNFLIHILLLWTTIISIIQIVIIILFFTAGHKGLSQDSGAVEPSKMPIKRTVTTFPPNDTLLLSQGKMLTFKASKAEGQIKWLASRPDKALMLTNDKGLTVLVDGYYFINLQVTLASECKVLNNRNVSVVKIGEKTKVLLEGSINNKTLSTGILSRMEELASGDELIITINSSASCVNETESQTHLDIIFMLR